MRDLALVYSFFFPVFVPSYSIREKRKIRPGASLFLCCPEEQAFLVIFDILADKRPISWCGKRNFEMKISVKKCHTRSKGENVFVIDQHIGKAALNLACLRSRGSAFVSGRYQLCFTLGFTPLDMPSLAEYRTIFSAIDRPVPASPHLCISFL